MKFVGIEPGFESHFLPKNLFWSLFSAFFFCRRKNFFWPKNQFGHFLVLKNNFCSGKKKALKSDQNDFFGKNWDLNPLL